MDQETMGADEGHDESTYFLPKGCLPEGMEVKSGDTLEFKVVGQDKDGNVEVSYQKGGDDENEEGKSWQDDMRASVAESGNPQQQG